MIFISLKTTKILTLQQEIQIKNSLQSLFLEQLKEKTMIQIEDNQLIYFDDEETDCVLIKCYFEIKENSIKDCILRIIESITAIPLSHQKLIIVKNIL